MARKLAIYERKRLAFYAVIALFVFVAMLTIGVWLDPRWLGLGPEIVTDSELEALFAPAAGED